MSSLWMIVASLLFSLMGVFIKLSAATISVAEIVFYRTAINFIVAAVIVGVCRHGVRTTVPLLHLRRGLIGNLAVLLGFYSIAHLPIATATTLNYTNPIFLALLSALLLGKRPNLALGLSVLLGFLGILLLLQPSLAPAQYPAAAVGLACGLVTALAYYNVGQLVRKGEPETRVVFYFSLTGAVGSLAWLSASGFSAVDGRTALYILAFGLCGTLGQLAMTRAYGRGNALTTGVLSYTTIIFSALFGVLAFHEQLRWSALYGIGLIMLAGCSAMVFRQHQPAAQRAPAASALPPSSLTTT